MEIYILPLLFIIFSSIMKSISDTIKFHWNSSIFNKIPKDSKLFNWLNPDYAWQNMWKDKYKPLGERFWGSSRWFAFLCDGWHLFDLLKTTGFICALTFFNLYIPISSYIINNLFICRCIDTIILFSIFGFIFEKLFVLYEK